MDPFEHTQSDSEEEDSVFQYFDAVQRYDVYEKSRQDRSIQDEILTFDEFISDVRGRLDDDICATPAEVNPEPETVEFQQLEKHPGFDLGPVGGASDAAEAHLTLNRTTRRHEAEERDWLHRKRIMEDGCDVPNLSTHDEGIIMANITERRERQERERSLLRAAGIARVRQTVSAEHEKMMRQCFYSRDKIFRNFGLIRDFTILSVVEAKTMEEIVIATDVPKRGGGGSKMGKGILCRRRKNDL